MCAVVQFVLDLGSVDLHYLSFGERARIGEIGQGVGGGGGSEKFEVLTYWGSHLSLKIVTVCVIIMNFTKLEHLKAGIKGEELFL